MIKQPQMRPQIQWYRHGRGGRTIALEIAWWLLALTAVALFMVLKLHGLGHAISDDNIYFYAAKLMAGGTMPYRDFFFAHPPLHLAVPALVYKIFGFDLTVSRLIPVGATMVSAVMITALVRRHMGRLAALVTLIAYLLAGQVLKGSTNLTGVNLTAMWMVVGLWAVMARRFAIGGVMMGLAVGTGIYALAAALALAVVSFGSGWRRGLRMCIPFVATIAVWNLAGLFVGGEQFVAGVYSYHGLKEKADIINQLLIQAHYHPRHIWAFILAPFLVFLSGAVGSRGQWHLVELLGPRAFWLGDGDGDGKAMAVEARKVRKAGHGGSDIAIDGAANCARFAWLLTAALIMEFSLFKELHSHYFTLWFPTLSILVGYVTVLCVKMITLALKNWEHGGIARGVLGFLILVFLVMLPVFGLFEGVIVNRQERRMASGEIRADSTGFLKERAQKGTMYHFTWSPSPVLPRFGELARHLFWRDYRIAGEWQPGFRWYLQSKKRTFLTAQEIASFIRENSAPGETIAGASTIAPLLALLSGREIAALEVDTNSKRFKSGMITMAEYFERICSDRVRFIVGAPQSLFSPGLVANHGTVRTQFRVVRQFHDKGLLHWRDYPITIYERVTPDAPVGRSVCRYIP